MYTLVTFQAALLVACAVEGFARGSRPARWATSLLLLTTALTHNWGLVLCASIGVWWLSGRWTEPRVALQQSPFFLAPALAYIVLWGAVLLEQLSSSVGPGIAEFAGGRAAQELAWVLGGPLVVGLAAVSLVAVGAERSRPGPPRLPAGGSALVGLGFAAAGGVLLTYVLREAMAGWVARYLVLLLVPMILGLAAVAGMTRPGRVLLAIPLLVTGAVNGLYSSVSDEPPTAPYATRMAELLDTELGRAHRTIVVSPSSAALLRWYMGDRHTYVTPIGPVPANGVLDYRQREERLSRPDDRLIDETVQGLEPQSTIVVVDEPTESGGYHQLQAEAMEHWSASLASDPRLMAVDEFVMPREPQSVPHTLTVFQRR